MNKLYCIIFKHNGVPCGYRNFWNEKDAIDFMKTQKEYWKFIIVEDNDSHKIWKGV